eukprot:TRINITY_DN7083_c0_g3_i1.p1 TRINITY_DN7083_c0_g3~~TRINITY_DN7083_c0_g3_i1.p1  ORF type:complete len:258 (+),score=11.49 TRINITY_DN7083_c0_g3_i1:70-774(+)
MRAKLTDFGMATTGPDVGETHVSTRVMGTMGYLDPKYLETGHLTPKSDIYALGVVYLELLTGRPPAGEEEEERLTGWIRPHISVRRPDLDVIVDPRMGDQYSKVGAQKLLVLAKHCISEDPAARPQIQDLVKTLQQIAALRHSRFDSSGSAISASSFGGHSRTGSEDSVSSVSGRNGPSSRGAGGAKESDIGLKAPLNAFGASSGDALDANIQINEDGSLVEASKVVFQKVDAR